MLSWLMLFLTIIWPQNVFFDFFSIFSIFFQFFKILNFTLDTFMFIDSYSKILLDSCQILSTTTLQSSVLLIIGRAEFYAKNTVFFNNSLISGLVTVFQLADVLFENSSFFNNKGEKDGSLFLLKNCHFAIKLKNCDFRENSSPGKLFMVSSANLEIFNTSFKENKGEIFLQIFSALVLSHFYVYNHSCPGFNDVCFLTVLVDSVTNVSILFEILSIFSLFLRFFQFFLISNYFLDRQSSSPQHNNSFSLRASLTQSLNPLPPQFFREIHHNILPLLPQFNPQPNLLPNLQFLTNSLYILEILGHNFSHFPYRKFL